MRILREYDGGSMVFSSPEFLLFFLPAVLVLYHLFKSIHWRNAILMIASLIFYAWGEPVYIFLMLASILINWLVGLGIDRYESQSKRKSVLIVGLVFDIGILFIFKYLSFFCKNIGLLLGTSTELTIALPIGISFFTFQIMSYLIDVYRHDACVQKNIVKLALYITMFPQLIAGPIVRYQTIAEEISNRRSTPDDFTEGMVRFVYGLSKKIIISNYVASIADNIFALGDDSLSVMTAWLGAIAYTLQIYFDFSGYSDMAIGLGLIFGFHFEENFNYPYAASSVTDFWRRWHISLSVWFRDYVYIPMGGNRVSKKRWILNLFTVWLLTGIWHGANWTFVLWGLLYFVVQLIEKLTHFPEKMKAFSHVYTMLVVVLLWVIFRSDTVSEAFHYIGVMFGGGYCFSDKLFTFYLDSGKWVLIAGAVFALPVCSKIKEKLFGSGTGRVLQPENGDQKSKALSVVWNLVSSVSVLVLFVLCVILCVNSTYNPFIYFNF